MKKPTDNVSTPAKKSLANRLCIDLEKKLIYRLGPDTDEVALRDLLKNRTRASINSIKKWIPNISNNTTQIYLRQENAKIIIECIKSEYNISLTETDLSIPLKDFERKYPGGYKKNYVPSDASPITDAILNAWKFHPKPIRKILVSSVYQIFRRYKDTLDHHINDNSTPRHFLDDPIICELAFINRSKMTGILITTDFNIYSGSFVVHYNYILSGLLHRTGSQGSHFRYLTVKLWDFEIEDRFRTISGMQVKTGDTSKRPVASELILQEVPRSEHRPVYDAMIRLFRSAEKSAQTNTPLTLQRDLKLLLADYMTARPPRKYNPSHDRERVKRIRYVKDFPLLAALATRKNGSTMLRSPSRTLSLTDLKEIEAGYTFGVFNQNQPHMDLGIRAIPPRKMPSDAEVHEACLRAIAVILASGNTVATAWSANNQSMEQHEMPSSLWQRAEAAALEGMGEGLSLIAVDDTIRSPRTA